MPRDYKHRAQSADKGPGGCGRCLFHFVGGLLLGAFAVGLWWLYSDPALLRSGRGLERAGLPRPPTQVASEAAPKPDYYFLDNLSRVEVEVPPPERAPPARPKAPARAGGQTTKKVAAPEPPAARQRFLLQLGSFRRRADAERLKAEVAFLGVQARISKVRVGGKDDYYRVRIGPFQGRAATDEARRRLRGHHIESIPIQVH